MSDEIPGQSVGDTTDLNLNPDAGGRDLAELEQEPAQVEGEQTEPGTIDEDAFIEKITKRWEESAARQPQQQVAAKQYTPEELDTLFNVYKPSPELLKAIREGDEEAGIKALVEMREGLQKQFATVMEYTLQAKLAELDKRYLPAVNEAQRIAGERSEKEFYTANGDLNSKSGKKIVGLVFGQFQQDVAAGRRSFKTSAEASKAVADEARAMLKELGVSASPNGASPQQPRKMVTLARAGGPGSSSPRGSSAPTGVGAALRELA